MSQLHQLSSLDSLFAADPLDAAAAFFLSQEQHQRRQQQVVMLERLFNDVMTQDKSTSYNSLFCRRLNDPPNVSFPTKMYTVIPLFLSLISGFLNTGEEEEEVWKKWKKVQHERSTACTAVQTMSSTFTETNEEKERNSLMLHFMPFPLLLLLLLET